MEASALVSHRGEKARNKAALATLLALILTLVMGGAGFSGDSGAALQKSDRGPCAPLPPASARDFPARLDAFVKNFCYRQQDWQYDAHVRTSDGVHLFVQIWYSPSLFNWMTVRDRRGPVPDGAMLVKEEHLSLTSPLLLWSLMIKDSNLSWDGWYWASYLPRAAPLPRRQRRRTARAPNRRRR